MKLPRLDYLKKIYPGHAPFHTQSCIYRAVSAAMGSDRRFADLEFVDELTTPVIFDYQGPDVSLPSPGWAGNTFEGHMDYWYHDQEKSLIVTGHDHVCQHQGYTSLGFDYWDWIIYRQFSDPMLYHEINRLGVEYAQHDVLLLVGAMRDHRRLILTELHKRGLGHNWITDPAHGMLPEATTTADAGLEIYFNKVGTQRFQQYTQYAHWANTDDSCSIDHLPHAAMYANCRVNLILETTAQTTSAAFLTEKTWKALAQARPFVIFGDTNSLAKLQHKGFRTFGGFCDESYDHETDLAVRAVKCIEAIKQMISAMKHHSDEIDDICRHNQSWFLSTRRQYSNLVNFGHLCLEHIYA